MKFKKIVERSCEESEGNKYYCHFGKEPRKIDFDKKDLNKELNEKNIPILARKYNLPVKNLLERATELKKFKKQGLL